MNNDKYYIEIEKNIVTVFRTQMLKKAKRINISITIKNKKN